MGRVVVKLRMISAAAAAMFAFTAGMALANTFNVPGGDLDAALDVYSQQSGVRIAVSMEAVQGMKTTGAKGEMSPEAALMKILHGTGLSTNRDASGVVEIVRKHS